MLRQKEKIEINRDNRYPAISGLKMSKKINDNVIPMKKTDNTMYVYCLSFSAVYTTPPR